MIKQKFESKTMFKYYCETCQASYMSCPGEGCPGCRARQEREEKAATKTTKTKKGGGKNE